ncbi:MAG: pyrimidine reductase family protein [Actinomycetes bacterium]
MRQLLPSYAPTVDLSEAYRYPADRTWVRANMVSSLDGSAVKDGRSGGLSGPADKALFGLLRGLCDVVLVGAGTARAEGYRALKAKEEFAEMRARAGQRPAPVLAVVSSRLDLDPESALFTGVERTIVVTTAADTEARARLEPVADIVDAGESLVDVRTAVDRLADRGLTRVLCEGGPSLLADVIAAGRLDELCLSWAPVVVGGSGTRIVHGPEVDAEFEPAHLLEEDGALFGRYVRSGAG